MQLNCASDLTPCLKGSKSGGPLTKRKKTLTSQSLTSQIYPPRLWTCLETLLQLKKYISWKGRLHQVERNISWFKDVFLELSEINSLTKTFRWDPWLKSVVLPFLFAIFKAKASFNRSGFKSSPNLSEHTPQTLLYFEIRKICYKNKKTVMIDFCSRRQIR